MQKTYMCIDLKTFFASVECVERGLDPFSTNLVVADPSRGKRCNMFSNISKDENVRNKKQMQNI